MAVAIQRNPLADESRMDAMKRRQAKIQGGGAPSPGKPGHPTVTQDKIEAMERMRNSQQKEITGKNKLGIPQPDKVSPEPILNAQQKTQQRFLDEAPKPTPAPTPAEGAPAPTPAEGYQETAYDLQRQKIEANVEADKNRQREALEKRLVSQGITGGMADAQRRLLEAEFRKVAASQKGEIDIQELLAGERSKEAEKGREFQASESELGRELAREVEEGRLSLEESRLAENVRQFDSEDEFKRWAIKGGHTAEEAARAWQSGENALNRAQETGERKGQEQFLSGEAQKDRTIEKWIHEGKMSQGDRQFLEEVRQFNTQRDFNKYAFDKGLDEKESQRLWETRERIGQEVYQAQQNAINIQAKESFRTLEENLRQGTMSFANAIEDQNKLTGMKAEAAYNMGQTGSPPHSAVFAAWSPMEKWAYISGQQGKSVQEFNEEKQKKIDVKNAVIATVDIDNPDFAKIFGDLFGLPSGMTVEGFQASLAKQKEEEDPDEPKTGVAGIGDEGKDKKFKCSKCNVSFSTNSELQKHLKAVHEGSGQIN